MSRLPKKYINTPFFHIMVQGINKEYIFDNKKDLEKYLEIIKSTKKETNLKILSYCMMCNHAHFLIFSEKTEELTKFMHKVNLNYAKYYNKKYERVGYVFRDRYKAQLITSYAHLLSCIDYIHNNPVKANICKKPEEYSYSSYNYNIYETQSEIEKNIRSIINYKKSLNNENDDFIFMECDEKNKEEFCKKVINDFLTANNLDRLELSKNKNILVKLIDFANVKNNVSLRSLEKQLGISREKLRKIKEGI